MSRRTALFSWRSLMLGTGMRCNFPGTFHEFEDIYSEPHRHYHTLEHIDMCLGEFLQVFDLAENPSAIQLAIWFHDIVYDTHRSDNEEESAYRALEFCTSAGLERYAATVQKLVYATKHTEGATDWTGDTALFVDVDLSILGQKDHVFDRYDLQIQKEYDWSPKTAFRKGRTEFLHSLLARPAIYHTEFFREKYERQARENLARSIEQLRGLV